MKSVAYVRRAVGSRADAGQAPQEPLVEVVVANEGSHAIGNAQVGKCVEDRRDTQPRTGSAHRIHRGSENLRHRTPVALKISTSMVLGPSRAFSYAGKALVPTMHSNRHAATTLDWSIDDGFKADRSARRTRST